MSLRNFLWPSVALCFAAVPDSAISGGFDRFEQDVSLLFDPANFVVSTSAAYVFISNEFESVNGRSESVPVGANFPLLNAKAKFTPARDIACLLHSGVPFGSDVDYGELWSGARFAESLRLRIYEQGLTCSYQTDVGRDAIRIIGGATRDRVLFNQSADNIETVADTSIAFRGNTSSFRAGLSYESPSNGLLATMMYYAPMDFNLKGHIANFPLGSGTTVASLPITGSAAIPGAIDVNLRATIHSDWILGASLKWMDWSEFDKFPLMASAARGSVGVGETIVNFRTHFRDGWTIGGYVANAFDERTIGVLRVVWDRSVSTGWTEQTSSWSLLGGVSYRLDENFELYGGVGLSLLESGLVDKKAQGGLFNATLDEGYAVVPQLSLTGRF
jgi:long-subunit fatty acid transport protein